MRLIPALQRSISSDLRSHQSHHSGDSGDSPASVSRSPAPSTSGQINPFATPPISRPVSRPVSRPASTFGISSGFQYAEVPGTKYFRSRRVLKGTSVPLPIQKKSRKEKLLWIMPLCGVLVGLGITGLLVYLQIASVVHHNYCVVLDEDFSSGILDPKVWTKEVEVGGFGNLQFEHTTGGDENAFIKDGQLIIKPTLEDESRINNNNVVNLLADGTCTSKIYSNCVTSTNTTNGTIVQPVKSARLNTKLGATIKYGRVEVVAKIPKGDWLWPAIWMMPVNETYGAWPASGEIDIMESRGNNYTYSSGGNNIVASSLHWGTTTANDAYKLSKQERPALHSQFGDEFHLFGLEWSEKYLFTYIDNTLQQVVYWKFDSPMWPRGKFPLTDANGTQLVDPWSQTGRDQTPFDQEFYLIINVAVGGQNGWFTDGRDSKPWVDASPTAKRDFWNARDQWYPTWSKNGQMVVETVRMWQQC